MICLPTECSSYCIPTGVCAAATNNYLGYSNLNVFVVIFSIVMELILYLLQRPNAAVCRFNKVVGCIIQ